MCLRGDKQNSLQGLVMPPRVASTQVVVVPIPNSKLADEAKAALAARAQSVADELRAAGLRVALDERDNYTPGWKYSYWELRVRGPVCLRQQPSMSLCSQAAKCIGRPA